MSTIDPAELKRQRELSGRGKPRALVWLGVGDLTIVVGAVLLARAGFAFGDIPAEGTGDGPSLMVFAMGPGILLSILGTFVHIGALRSYTGELLPRSPFLGSFPLRVIGLAAGAWWGWTGVGGMWILIPLALTLAAVLLVVLSFLARAAARRRDRESIELVATGRIVPGVVTEIAEINPSSGGLIGPVTVRFADAAGTERWVTKSGQWRRADLPRNGDAAAVLFDPADPGNTDRIRVGPPGARTDEDFRAWTRS